MLDANVRTPEEAKQKWCPMYRLAVRDRRLRSASIDNRMGKCLAEDCQDWLWDKREPSKGYCGFVTER